MVVWLRADSYSSNLCQISNTSSVAIEEDLLSITVSKKIVELSLSSSDCQNIVSSVIPKFKLELKVVDDTGSAVLILFYREVYQFLGSSAIELLQGLIVLNRVRLGVRLLQPSSVPPLHRASIVEGHIEELQWLKELLRKRSPVRVPVRLRSFSQVVDKEQGTRKTLHCDQLLKGESYSETVVKVFYSNLTWDDEEKCMLSEVRGKIIKVSHEKLAKLLGVRSEGHCFIDQASLEKIPNYDAQIVLRALIPDNAPSHNVVANFLTSKFKVGMRFLHYIVSSCLFKKGGNTSHASVVEQFAMYCIMTDTKFNIPSLMIERMMRCTRVTNVSLPYASLVTLILEKYKINPYEGDIKNPIPIDGNSVSRSGHTKYFNSWVPKENTSQRRKRMEEIEGHEAPAASAENLGSSFQPAPQDSSDILSAIWSVQAIVDRHFDALEARMDQRFDAVKDRFDTMTRRLQALELTAADHTTDIKGVLMQDSQKITCQPPHSEVVHSHSRCTTPPFLPPWSDLQQSQKLLGLLSRWHGLCQKAQLTAQTVGKVWSYMENFSCGSEKCKTANALRLLYLDWMWGTALIPHPACFQPILCPLLVSKDGWGVLKNLHSAVHLVVLET
ncbi:hypothetical protein G2W53_017669 [Senna tora]|uniref:Putative plant transposon protein domain-containing protein n=1 Tax=Senna tora TaxID=362788 RepID=A0A834WKE1_9FABA|nr:hypothetical protein G2W53_017669 [Senna tora]